MHKKTKKKKKIGLTCLNINKRKMITYDLKEPHVIVYFLLREDKKWSS